MADFSAGKLSLLVATSVVEVGVDTSASVMCVLAADRFGLASLHQLRGRVVIMHKPAPHLDGEYAAFGKITEGLDIVDQIANVPTNFQDCPTTPVVIKTIRRA